MSEFLAKILYGINTVIGSYGWSMIIFTLIVKLLMLPLVVSIAYEINRWVGRHDNAFSRILTAPGLWMQNFTTNEPDEQEIEVAIASVKKLLEAEHPEIKV